MVLIEITNRKFLNIFVAFFYVFNICLFGINEFVNLFFYGTPLDSVFLYSLLLMLLLLAIFSVIYHLKLIHLIVFLVIFIVSILSCLINPYPLIVSKVLIFLTTVAPFYFIGATFTFTSLEKYLRHAVICAFIAASMYVVNSTLLSGGYVHDMTASYSLLPVSILSQYFAFSTRKPQYYFLMIIFGLEVFLLGVRGPILLYLIGLIFVVVKFSFKRKQKLLFLIFIGIIMAVIAGYLNSVVIFVDLVFKSLNIENGAFNRLVNNTFFGDSGRINMFKPIVDQIESFPIVGNGIFADRLLLDGSYTHNLIIEICFNLGIILGPILFGAFLISIFKLIRFYREDNFVSIFLFSLVVITIGQHMISGSYLENPFFFLLIGIIMNPSISPNLRMNELRLN